MEIVGGGGDCDDVGAESFGLCSCGRSKVFIERCIKKGVILGGYMLSTKFICRVGRVGDFMYMACLHSCVYHINPFLLSELW